MTRRCQSPQDPIGRVETAPDRMATIRPMSDRVPRIVAAVAALLLLAASHAGGGAVSAAARGGCEPSSSTCYFFDVGLSGSGSGVYATIDDNLTFTGRMVCAYGNEEQAGVCGWGYQPAQPGFPFDVIYQLRPDAGSQACDTQHCYGGTFSRDLFITGNYYETSWRFELVNPVQVVVQLAGTGQGTVVSDPGGIACPPDCDDQFAQGQELHLTAQASNGSVFAGWSGACTGVNSGCVLTPTSQVTAIATFNKRTIATPQPETPTDEPTTDAPATDAPTDEPTAATPTDAPSVEATPGATAVPVAATADVPGTTANPAATGSSGGGSNLPIVILLVVLLAGLGGGAFYAFRRGGGAAGP